MLKYDILATANNYRWDKPLYELSAEQSGCLQLLSSCLDFYTWKIFLDALCLLICCWLIGSLSIGNHITCVLNLGFAQTPSKKPVICAIPFLLFLATKMIITYPDGLLSCSVSPVQEFSCLHWLSVGLTAVKRPIQIAEMVTLLLTCSCLCLSGDRFHINRSQKFRQSWLPKNLPPLQPSCLLSQMELCLWPSVTKSTSAASGSVK